MLKYTGVWLYLLRTLPVIAQPASLNLALGEMRPQMMGTPAFMPLEVMLESVQTHPSQDVFAMGVMAFLVCVSPDKAQPNLFISPVRVGSRKREHCLVS